MLKRPITYTNFDGETVTETYYFNLSKSELLMMEVGSRGKSFSEYIKEIVDAKDANTLMREFRSLILLSYGVRSDDGKRFVKSETLSKEFEQSFAFDALYMELVESDKAASDFMLGVIPKDLEAAASKNIQELAVNPVPTTNPVPE